MLYAIESGQQVRFVGFPFGFYKPETSVALGFGGGIYFRLRNQDESYNTSSVALAGFYSFKNYYSLTIKPDIYLNQWRSRMLATLRLENQDDSFFGVGINSRADDEVIYKYSRQQFIFEFTTLGFLIKELDRGIILDLSHFEIKDVRDTDYVQDPVFDDNYRQDMFGIGARADYDKRDDLHYPTEGYYLGLRFLTFRKELGSDYEYDKLIIDLRKYILTGERQTIANQLYSSQVFEDVPFFSMSSLGGSEIMRGYYEGRFRNRNSLIYQTEYRIMFLKKWGAVAFANLGTVYNDVDEIKLSDVKASFGIGGRFLLIPEDRINLRADFGFGKDSFGFYFIIDEAF
jgi:outer membrane protein assembly factor BamA